MTYKNLLFFSKSGQQKNFSWNGDFWEGRILLPQVSENLFEIEHLFIVEKLLNTSDEVKYGIPHIDIPDEVGNVLGITANFIYGTDQVILSSEIPQDFLGATIWNDGGSPYKILAIDGKNITVDQNVLTGGLSSISFGTWRARFETPYNIVDFDEINPIKVNWKNGDNFLTSSSDLTLIKPGYLITGSGLPDNTRIISVTGNKILVNKKLVSNKNNVTSWVYLVEDRNDVSNRVYQYVLTEDPDLDAPVLLNIANRSLLADFDPSQVLDQNLRKTSVITEDSFGINLAVNSDQEGCIGRVLVIEDISTPTVKTILRLEISAEVIGEDERLNSLLENFGQGFYKEDANILRDSDPNEPFPDHILLNEKRKELLLQGSEIFPYIGSYKGLVNIISFFGYQDLAIKEYWLNIKKSSVNDLTPRQQNETFLNDVKSIPHGESVLINNLLDDENSGKYKQVEIYGLKEDGTYGIKSALNQIFPSTAYKKTPLFGLFYDLNEVVPGEEDKWGYPVTKSAFLFSPEEVLIKLFALKEKLKKDYLPLSAKIIDITGEGIYFSVNKTRGWVDTLKIDSVNLGLDVNIEATPKVGYVEDLRAFQTRSNADFPQVPYIPGKEGEVEYSTFGNIKDVNPFNQYYTPEEVKSLVTAIESYYETLNSNGNRMDLGDGDYNNPGYLRYADKSEYYIPAGFPTVIETTSFNISMNEVNTSWETLDRNISTYSTTLASIGDLSLYDGNPLIMSNLLALLNVQQDFLSTIILTLPVGLTSRLNPSFGKIQLKIEVDSDNYIVAEVQSYDNLTGITTLFVLGCKGTGTYSAWKVSLTNLFSQRIDMEYYNYTIGSDGLYSWDNLRFLGFYEIEWTITKNGVNPYNYQFRGKIKDYWKLPHFLPYIGEYTIKCRVWNSFNDISIGYANKYITVEPRNIELNSVTRFRQAEKYNWDSMVLPWDSYDTPWVSPIEQQESQPEISQRNLTYSEYGNQFNEGQECKVLKTFPEVVASLTFNVGVISHEIISIDSTYGSGLGPATVTTNTAHNLNPGDEVYIVDNSVVDSITGEYIVLSVTPTTFTIPLIVPTVINTPGNYLSGPGSVTIKYKNREYTTVSYNGSIEDLAGTLYSSMNGAMKEPRFRVKSYDEISVIGLSSDIFLYSIVINSPIGTGSMYNGDNLDISSQGSIVLNLNTAATFNSISPNFQGGINEHQDYVDYQPGDDLPIPAMKDWGSKQITWDSMNDITWDQMYAQTMPMLDYHQDWLGGFDLYNVRYGDLIRVGKNNKGVVIGQNGSPTAPMFLYDVARQLNESSDPGISKFNYSVRGYSRVQGKYDSNGYNLIENVISPHIIYSQSTVNAANAPADYAGMTNNSYRESTQTATNNGPSEWIQMDFNEIADLRKIVIGCDFDNVLSGGWGPTYTENKNVEYSNDGINWTFLFNTGNFSQGIQEYPVNIKAQYVRIVAPAGDYVAVTEFYGMIPYDGEIGPMDESTFTYDSLGFTPTSICKGNHGEMYLADGDKIHIFHSPDDIEIIQLDYSGTYLQTDRKGRIWYYGNGEIPLQIVDMKHPDRKIAFISETGVSSGYYMDIVIPASFTSASISCLAIDEKKDDFAIILEYSTVKKLFYYDGGKKEFESYDTDDGLPSMNIRQMLFDYKGGNKTLWLATASGISVYDRIKFFNYKTSNSGLFSNDVYSICLDELDNKWIGTSSGITYYDGEVWAVWNSSNSPSLPAGVTYTNIVNTGYGNIFFVMRYNTGDYKFGYFNGDNFLLHSVYPGSHDLYDPYIDNSNYENHWFFACDIKHVAGEYSQYPGNIFQLDSNQFIRQTDYIIPHIHASSKYPGHDGWDFIYYNSSRSLPTLSGIFPLGVGYGIIDFNFIVGPINGNYILSSNFRPKFPFVDWYSWKMPNWINADYSRILSSRPDLNPDHLFLDAPLRDIINGNALKEEYWRNPPIERIDIKQKRDLIANFEWLIKLGDSMDDRGINITVGKDGYIYTTGYFSGSVYFGSPNNVNSGHTTTLHSPNCRSIFVAKYNSVGIIQWARMYGEDDASPTNYDYDFTPTSIKLDTIGNVYVVGYKEKNRNNVSGELPSNILLRWDWNGNIVSYTQLFTPSSNTAFDENFDVVVDDVSNLYISGIFKGTLDSGNFTIQTEDPNISEVYVAKVEHDGYIKYLNKLGTGTEETNPALCLGSNNDLYVSFSSTTLSTSDVVVRAYNALSFDLQWEKKISYSGISILPIKAVIDLSNSGEIVLGLSYVGKLSCDNIDLYSVGQSDLAIFKFLVTGKLLWARNIGSSYGNSVSSIKVDVDDRIYMLSSYSGTLIENSPNPIEESVGDLDVLLLKLEKDGTLIDLVSTGSLSKDEGMGLSLDAQQNIYITGYLSAEIENANYITSPTVAGSNDIFIGKIPYQRYIPGRSLGGVISTVGLQSWGSGDKRIYNSEFEIPLGTTVFINPLDSNIPGKKDHKWRLIERSTGNVIVDLKNIQYFIWNFKKAGFYDIEMELLDTNNNPYKVYKDGYIRVVDHTSKFNEESVPHLITSKDFKDQSIYRY